MKYCKYYIGFSYLLNYRKIEGIFMKKLLFLLIIILIPAYISAQSGSKLNIAVNNLVGNGIENSTINIISNRLRSELINTGVFRVMERNEMENVLKEQGFQKTGACNEASCLVEVGQILGVDRMVAGSVGRVESFFTIDLRIINVATGEILYTVNEDFEGTIKDVISIAIRNASKKLALGAGVEVKKAAMIGKKGDLYIESNQDAAMVEIDGKQIPGETPLTLKGFDAGEHRIVVRKDEWYGVKTINLNPDDLLKIMIPMEKGKGSIKIFTNEIGANVFLDGNEVGQTPIKVDNVTAGEHIIDIKKNGFFTVTQNTIVSIGETQNISIQLDKAATLSFTVNPNNATVSVNERKIISNDYRNYEVVAGEVDIQVEAPGYDVYHTKINLEPGTNKDVQVNLKSVFGRLELTTNPKGGTVFINNKETGKTPYKNIKLKPGNYMVKIVQETYEPIKRNISIIKDSTAYINLIMTHTATYFDSLSKAKKISKKRKQMVRRIILGTLAVGSGVTGIFMNNQADEALNRYNSINDFNQGQIDSEWNEFEKFKLIRNIIYGFGGGFSVGFILSIPL